MVGARRSRRVTVRLRRLASCRTRTIDGNGFGADDILKTIGSLPAGVNLAREMRILTVAFQAVLCGVRRLARQLRLAAPRFVSGARKPRCIPTTRPSKTNTVLAGDRLD